MLNDWAGVSGCPQELVTKNKEIATGRRGCQNRAFVLQLHLSRSGVGMKP
jgi:hypothetical protein